MAKKSKPPVPGYQRAHLKILFDLVENGNLKRSDPDTYSAILSFRNIQTHLCFPSQKEITKRLNLKPTSIKWVRESIKRLARVGLIHRDREKAGWHYKHHYRFALLGDYDVGLERLSKITKRGRIGEKSPLLEGLTKIISPTLAQSPEAQKTRGGELRGGVEAPLTIEVVENFSFYNSLSKKVKQAILREILAVQKIWREWGVAPGNLKSFPLLEVLLQTEYTLLRRKREIIRSMGGFLFDRLRNRRKIPKEGDAWIPGLSGLRERILDRWLPKPEYLASVFCPTHLEDIDYELKKYGKSAYDLCREGILQKKFWWPDLTQKGRSYLEQGKYDYALKKTEQDTQQIKALREQPEKFFEQLKPLVLENLDTWQKGQIG